MRFWCHGFVNTQFQDGCFISIRPPRTIQKKKQRRRNYGINRFWFAPNLTETQCSQLKCIRFLDTQRFTERFRNT